MWELDCVESWALKNWCFWTVVLEKTLESPLDCKEIQPGHPKGDQSWVFIGRTDAKAETPIFWPPHGKSWLIGKDPDAGRDWGQEEKGTTEDEMAWWHHQLNGHEFGWTPGVGDGQGGLACCNSWGHKDLDTNEWLNWTELISSVAQAQKKTKLLLLYWILSKWGVQGLVTFQRSKGVDILPTGDNLGETIIYWLAFGGLFIEVSLWLADFQNQWVVFGFAKAPSLGWVISWLNLKLVVISGYYHESEKRKKSENVNRSVLSEFLRPHALYSTRLLHLWNSTGKNTGVGSHSLLQGLFPDQISCISGRFFTIWATRGAYYHENMGT